MRALITGAAGFAGNAIARRLLADGADVCAYVREAGRARDLAGLGAHIEQGDLGDPNAIARAATGCEVLVHAAAARPGAGTDALEWTNVAGTENVLNAARRAGCKRVVQISCSDVTLTNQDRVYWDEERYLARRPIGAHGRTKQLAEEIALCASTDGLEVTALRPAWLWGPGDTARLPELCAQGAGMRLVGSGENLFACTYIDHLAEAVSLAIDAHDAPGKSYYIADSDLVDAHEFFDHLSQAAGLPAVRGGAPFSIAYLLARARQLVGAGGRSPAELIVLGRASQFDTQLARKDLGWEPTVPMKDGMARLAAWVEAQGGAGKVAHMGRVTQAA